MRPGQPACRVPSRLRGDTFLSPSSWSFSPRSQSVPQIGDQKLERNRSRESAPTESEQKVRGIVGRSSHGGRRGGVIAGGDHRGFEWVGRAPVELPGTSWTRCPRATSVTGNVPLVSRQHQIAVVILRSDHSAASSTTSLSSCRPRRRRSPLCISATTTALSVPSSVATTIPLSPRIRATVKPRRRPPCLRRRNIAGASTPMTRRNITAIVALRRNSGECIHLWYRLFLFRSIGRLTLTTGWYIVSNPFSHFLLVCTFPLSFRLISSYCVEWRLMEINVNGVYHLRFSSFDIHISTNKSIFGIFCFLRIYLFQFIFWSNFLFHIKFCA